MTHIALLPNDFQRRGVYIGTKSLPDDYMGDFSLMGFVVDGYEEACGLLRSAGFQLEKTGEGAEIHIDNPQQLPEIQALLRRGDINCSYSDIADTLYQA